MQLKDIQKQAVRETTATYEPYTWHDPHDSTRRLRWHCAELFESDESGAVLSQNLPLEEPTDEKPYNLISSKLKSGKHSPCLDIDVPIEVIPSSRLGHHHVYFPSIKLDEPRYFALLVALADAGIISKGYLMHSVNRGQTLLRPPHVKKGGPDVPLPITDDLF